MRPLIRLERDAELEKAKEEREQATEQSPCSTGNTLFNLKCKGVCENETLKKCFLTFVKNTANCKNNKDPKLPPHRFTPHTDAEIRLNQNSVGPAWATGSVSNVKDKSITIDVNAGKVPEDGEEDQTFRIDKLPSDVTYKRLCETLELLEIEKDLQEKRTEESDPELVDIAFASAPLSSSENPDDIEFYNENLDDFQKSAVRVALNAHQMAMVHGPPGTGKTMSVIEIIAQEVKRGRKVLACASANIAVDNILSRLAELKHLEDAILRVGLPERLPAHVYDYCFVGRVEKYRCCLEENFKKQEETLKSELRKILPGESEKRDQIEKNLCDLTRQHRHDQRLAVSKVWNNTSVFCSTLCGAQGRSLENMKFDVVVIDEAAQALEVSCWGAMLKTKKAILAGDHLQLPPTIISEEAAKKGLGVTLFERMQKEFGDSASVMLTVQYRMNSVIMKWASDELYQSKLTAHETVENHTLNDLNEIQNQEDIPVCLFVDTAGCDCEEVVGEDGLSRANPDEAKAVMKHATELVSVGMSPSNIGIITPYNGQVSLLRELRAESMQQIEISSVDGFQGREKEAILISAVRSNESGEIGFLNDRRRMNVAVTRARRHCAIFADSGTLSGDPFLERLVSYFEAHGEYRSYEEFMQ